MQLIEAFNKALADNVRTPDRWYVCLIRREPFYGGPQEGGWWGEDRHLVAYAEFPTEEAANEALGHIEKLAKEITEDDARQFGEMCLRECELAEARGYDASDLPEVNGPDEHFVLITQELPKLTEFGEREWS
jgi:hypothetical protein